MNKKLLATLCCFTPLGAAFAENITITNSNYGSVTSMSDGNVYIVGSDLSQPGLTLGDVNLSGGITIGGDGASTTSSGWLYVLDNYFDASNSNMFTLNATGTVTLGGILSSGGYAFNLTGNGTNSATISGGITTDGTFRATDFAGLTIGGAINSNVGTGNTQGGDIELQAGTITVSAGATIAGAGKVNIAAGTELDIAGNLQFTGGAAGDYVLTAGSAGDASVGNITIDGTVQNESAGDVSIIAHGGDILVTNGGAIQNMGYSSGGVTTGGDMLLDAYNISAQYITNGYEGSTLTITAGGNLNLTGAGARGSSLELNGKNIIKVTGTAKLDKGWTLIGGGNTFSLMAGKLDISGVTDVNKLVAMFTNSWATYMLNIGNALNISGAGITNNSGNMAITAQSIIAGDVNSVATNGKLDLLAASNGTSSFITVKDIIAESKTQTNISTSGTLTAVDVNNSGEMVLGGQTVKLTSVTNNAGGNLTVQGYNNNNGTVTIGGNVTNNGESLIVQAGNVTIGGTLAANAGTTRIQGNGAGAGLNAQNIVVNGGVLNVNSLGGGVTVGNQTAKTGSLVVKSGALNFDTDTVNVTVYGEDGVTINGSVTVGGAAASTGGNVNIAAPAFTMTATGGAINVLGGIKTMTNSHATFIANNISFGGDIYANNSGHLTFGDVTTAKNANSLFTAGTGVLNAVGSGVIDIYHDEVRAGSVVGGGSVDGGGIFNLYGTKLNAGWVNVAGGLWFGGDESTKPQTGIFLNPAGGKFTLTADQNVGGNTGIKIGGIMSVGSGNSLTIDSVAGVTVGGQTVINGAVYQGTNGNKALNLVRGGTFKTNGFSVLGDFIADKNTVNYISTDDVSITGTTTVNEGAVVNIYAETDTGTGTISAKDVTVAKGGALTLKSGSGNTLGVVNNSGTLMLDSGSGETAAGAFTNTNTGIATLVGAGMTVTGDFTAAGILRQNYTDVKGGDVNIVASRYYITAANTTVNGIEQTSGSLVLNTNTLTVNGNIGVERRSGDVVVSANNATDLLTVFVDGNVFGGTDFMGVKSMNITGNYVFDNNSRLNAWINPDKDASSYWATVNTEKGDDYGKITNKNPGGEALITVGGQFITDLDLGIGSLNRDAINNRTLPNAPGALGEHQVGITITSMIDQGDAIWLLHATGVNEDGGTTDPIAELKDKIRNLYVQFCNYNGTICYNYFDSFSMAGTLDSSKFPAYISVRDSDGDGIDDSIYIVFDPDFGGPVEVFKIQPIVDAEAGRTQGEYEAAGALDDLIEGKLAQTGFFNRTPIEVIPLVFRGTNMETLMQELYERMEYYAANFDGAPLEKFSRLVQPREIEQVAGSVVLNEHTTFRDFEDHMFDEFIWNRNRNLKKAWVDVDFGWFNQKVADDKRASGNRFSIAGGFDWQESNTLILGLSAHVSHMSGDNSDVIDLSYDKVTQMGRVDVSVADTNIGVGGYLMKNLGNKSRVYGNAFLDLHMLDVSRDMTFMSSIDGSGTAVSLISEWGLLHDWLNQYVVGNLYARVGYNFGFSLTERAAGGDYMKLESDGYMILTPGYSLIAQKRIYPSAWFQIRPYASIGVEYDVLGAPDTVQYKFAVARRFTDYDIEIDPLWANIGGGVEVLSATGIQIGLDYRYQYNQDIQLHKIRLSGSYRF